MSIDTKEISAVVEVTVQVNGSPVKLNGPRVKGLEVKQAAINQGVKIQLDFVLSMRQANGKSKIVGNDDTITVTKDSSFRAIANDDNS